MPLCVLCFPLFQWPLLASANPNSMSVLLDKNKNVQDYIRIVDPPKILYHLNSITVAYRCQGDGQIGVEIRVWTPNQEDAMPFRKSWTCNDLAKGELHRTVTVKLADKLAYRPSSANPYTVFVDRAIIFAWILGKEVWERRSWNMFRYSLANAKNSVRILPPYDRPEKPVNVCYTWWKEIKLKSAYKPRCREQPGEVTSSLLISSCAFTYYNYVHLV